MQNINKILSNRRFEIDNNVKLNTKWELAKEFGDYVGLNTIFVLKLFRDYGMQQVLSTRSYLKDFPNNGEFKSKSGLIIYRLKMLQKEKTGTV